MKFAFSTALILISSLSWAQISLPGAVADSVFLKVLFPKAYSQIGQPFPEFSFTGKNKTINNSNLKGKVVLINFWFEGCHPCMAEMEALQELSEKLKDNKDFLFISISKDNKETIKRVKEKYSLTFDVFATTEQECRRLNYDSGYPTNLILDKTGALKFFHAGGSIKKEVAREHVMTKLLSEIQSIL